MTYALRPLPTALLRAARRPSDGAAAAAAAQAQPPPPPPPPPAARLRAPSLSPSLRSVRGHRAPRSAAAVAAAAANGAGGYGKGDEEAAAAAPELSAFLALRAQRRAAASEASEAPGAVYLVGTGPGDPGMLTLNALRLMQTADVVLYDRLVSTDILELVGAGAVMVYVGKRSGFHTRTQAEIHELLGAFAGAGARVVRLKGGDPFIFGRGGEECAYLRARGFAVHVVPGVTAASGIAAELGVPLTHRGVATSVRYLTGHTREPADGADADGEVGLMADTTHVDPHCTLVVYMGLGTLPALVASLRAGGMPADTPAVAVERGTTAEQRRVFTTVAELPAAAAETGLRSPALLVIGGCVALSPLWPFGAAGAAGERWQLQSGPVSHGVYLCDLVQSTAPLPAVEAQPELYPAAAQPGGLAPWSTIGSAAPSLTQALVAEALTPAAARR